MTLSLIVAAIMAAGNAQLLALELLLIGRGSG
jgi:hypothetical protein